MFKEYIQNQQILESELALMIYSMENYNTINEDLLTEMNINDFLSKFGLKFHKEGPGLIDYVTDFIKGTGKIFVAAVKGDKEEVKRIASKVTKEYIMDFLLKLDAATLHVVTGPIHIVDAITGWDLWADLEKVSKRSKNIVQDVWKALIHLKDRILKAFDDNRQKSLLSCVNKLEDMVPSPAVVVPR